MTVRWRSEHGSDWAIASLLVERMCAAVKCRATDDLAYVCERHPRLAHAQSSLARLPVQQLLDRATTRAAVPERALAPGTRSAPPAASAPFLRPSRASLTTASGWSLL